MKTNSFDDADFIVQKLACDMGIHRNARKGTLDAPKKILDGFNFDKNSVLVDEVFPDEFNLEETHFRIRENTGELASYGKPLVSLGGDHSVSFPVIDALKDRYPDLKLVWLDSHLDLKEKVGDNISHDVVVRELLNKGFSEDEIVFVGVTKVDSDEEAFLKARNIDVYFADEIDEFLREFSFSEQPCYLSIDIDVLEKRLAPGTGYPDGELNLEQVKKVIKKVKPSHADIVEVAPSLDNEQNDTINSSREILDSIASNLKY